MRRRDFITALGGAALSLPVRAQQRMPIVGYLGPESPAPFASRVTAFRDGLAEAGYVEGRNVEIVFRWAEGRYGRLPAMAVELASLPVSVIVAPGGAQGALAAKSVTTTIPIIFEMGGDPVALGMVPSLSRPGGNLTGVSSLSVEVGPKRLEFLHEVVPKATAIPVAVNPANPTADSQLQKLETAARNLGIALDVLHARSDDDFEKVFSAAAARPARLLLFTSDPFFAFRSEQLAALAIGHAVPAIHQSRDFPLAGGLMSYGGNFVQSHRQAGVQTGRVLSGNKPSELPVEQVTLLEFFINQRAADRLGVTIPPSLLVLADRVIEQG